MVLHYCMGPETIPDHISGMELRIYFFISFLNFVLHIPKELVTALLNPAKAGSAMLDFSVASWFGNKIL